MTINFHSATNPFSLDRGRLRVSVPSEPEQPESDFPGPRRDHRTVALSGYITYKELITDFISV